MAIQIETSTERLMVKLISSFNQILLVHCFLQMLFADFFRTETEADYFYQEGDDDERTLMDRADPLASLLPALAVLTLGSVVVVTNAGRFLSIAGRIQLKSAKSTTA
eukprot:GFUD01029413.1.p1 GENE.GFUD01029413.1~~GFUD01029413.1.p1  ORF type:complete len:107 (-),score=16.20 GFUD01029413.1:154-474(-)